MKLIATTIIAGSILFSAQAQAWDPNTPAWGWVDTFSDNCPYGCFVSPTPPARFSAEGWACDVGGTFDPNKLQVVRFWTFPQPISYLVMQTVVRDDVLAAGACGSNMVGFRVHFNNQQNTYNVFKIYYDGIPLKSNFLLVGNHP